MYLILCLSPLMGRDKLERINSNLIEHNSSIWKNFRVPHDTQTVSKNRQLRGQKISLPLRSLYNHDILLYCEELTSYQCSTKVPVDPYWNERSAVSDQQKKHNKNSTQL